MDSNCVFCDKESFRERIISENNDCYVIATLGQITDGGHVLIFPKEHIACLGALTKGLNSVMLKTAKETCRALSLEYQSSASTPYPVTAFEHGIVGQTVKHAHLHVLPAQIDLTAKIRSDFPEAKIRELQYVAQLQELYGERPRPYLFWTVPNGKSMVCWNPPAPPQYLRLIFAELMGRPEWGDWKNVDAALDKKWCDCTVVRLKHYF